MGRLLGALLFCVAGVILPAGVMADVAVDLELALAVDVSRSVDAGEARLQRDGYIKAFRDPDVIGAIRSGMLGRIAVAYFEWAGEELADVIVDWTVIDGREAALAFADALDRRTPASASWTSISGAINFAVPRFDGNGFQGSRRVIDISGDGPNNEGELVTAARDRAVAAGFTINGLPILDDGGGMFSRFNIPNLDLYYRDCVVGGPGAFVEPAVDFNDFARAVRRKLILEIAGRIPAKGPMLRRAQAAVVPRVSPPCDIGERILRGRRDF